MRINQINRRRSPPWHSNDNQNPRSDIASELLVFPMWFAPPRGPCGIWKWAYFKISLFFVFHLSNDPVAVMIGLNWTQRTVICWRWRTNGIWTNEICRVNINVCLCIIIRSPWDNSVHPKTTKFRFCLCSKHRSWNCRYCTVPNLLSSKFVLYQISYLASFL